VTSGSLGLLARTAVQLKPAQPAQRARLRAQRAALGSWPGAGRRACAAFGPGGPAAGWPAGFSPVDARIPGQWPGLADLRAGRFPLLGMTRELGDPPDWQQAGAPRLWRFHLHYWDWAWGLAASADRTAARAVFARLWRSWQSRTEFGRGDAWLPYPTALRAWSWCGLFAALVAGRDFDRAFAADLACHAGYLRQNLETDVGGNHLIKGLKALTGLAVFFSDERLLRRALHRLTGQLTEQVLRDGGHYERAPAYHCQVLADLIDVAGLLRAAGREPGDELAAAIAAMRRWLGAVLQPDGTVPLLNDGYPVCRELVRVLRPDPPRPAQALLVLAASGLIRAAAGGWHLLADVGPPCPPTLPAHAHADTLSCLVHVDGAPLLVDTGTSTYAPGPVRDHERSTAAHNTVTVDGADSTEVWGAFRAARRARVSRVAARAGAAGVTCQASHDGFRGLRGRPMHHRRWSVDESGLRVDDEITGRGCHEVAVRWHLAPGSAARLVPDGAVVTTPAGTFRMTAAGSGRLHVSAEPAAVAAGFGATVGTTVLACRVDAVLPVRVTTAWTRDGYAVSPSPRHPTQAGPSPRHPTQGGEAGT
jgi:uncharacterized heparinase superfamily protein